MSAEVAIVIFILFMIFAFFVSYFSALYMIDVMGLFEPNVFVATMINLLQGTSAIFIWFLYSIKISETLFFDGLLFGLTLLIVSEISLIVLLFADREKVKGYMKKWNGKIHAVKLFITYIGKVSLKKLSIANSKVRKAFNKSKS
ncbi:hypothetical protein GH741_14695 [Aquibacillus halophilus]|uniref:Uncharacterized protein n=1 Tax=Aquibacillus halophilus TaxID=930132 RepID=A0A6A8DJH6_9BACI|nr:hypothetical protein [Aquibacillus halophilus]MRH43889.1 hypothetical protein [Aquibacillus halophilus]